MTFRAGQGELDQRPLAHGGQERAHSLSTDWVAAEQSLCGSEALFAFGVSIAAGSLA